ncbi:T9SS type A sorting domain-containing protein [Flavobacterium longum]|uniref:T9SS type A sorting domain-containing protein n=1 Tax=Flavobacterium longum TaxID=1299340 RepID=UPI0039EAFE31
MKLFLPILYLSLAFSAAAQNDACTDAIEIFPSSTCQAVSGSFNGATISGDVPICADGASQDVWYKFTATQQMMGITLFGTAGVSNGFEVYAEGCTGNRIICRNINNATGSGENIQFNNFTIGTVYYIRVFNAFSAPTTNTFSLCLQDFAPPANDNCAAATVLTPATTCNATNFTLSGATLDGPTPVGSCSPNPSQDVWFSFTATTQMTGISVSGSSQISVGLQVYQDSCSGALFACRNMNGASSGETILLNTFTIGQTYLVRVLNEYATPLSTADFTICVQEYPAPSNDLCANAIPLQVNQSCVSTVAGFSGATLDGPVSTPTCNPNPSQDIWYSFTATNATMTVTIFGAAGISNAFELYAGSCGGAFVGCRNANGDSQGETLTFTTLTPGTVYFIRVVNAYATPLSVASFGVCVVDANLAIPETDRLPMSLYPNPSSEFVTIEMADGVQGKANFFNLLGMKVLEADTGFPVDVRGLTAGIYIVEVKSGNKSGNIRFVKQ